MKIASIILSLFVLSAGLQACKPPPPTDPIEVANLAAIKGTWVVEDGDGDRKEVEVFTLKEGEVFESTVTTSSGAQEKKVAYTGAWYLHGKQFKRQYTHENGKELSRKDQAYLTLELTAPISGNEFEAKDNIRNKAYRFKRKV